MTFWGGSGSGSADPCLCLIDPDPDPSIFVIDLQDPGGPKTCGPGGSGFGSGSATLVKGNYYRKEGMGTAHQRGGGGRARLDAKKVGGKRPRPRSSQAGPGKWF